MPTDDQIRHVLMTAWDPLSVGDNVYLRDEYDQFIPLLMDELSRSPSLDEMEGLLARFEDQLGDFDFDGSERRRAAAELLAL